MPTAAPPAHADANPSAVLPQTPAQAEFPTASVAELLRAPSTPHWRGHRLSGNASIFVIEFPGLTEQGMAMNRLAAMYEKRDGDRNRLLTDAAMSRLLRASGDSVGSFFQGHDYTGQMLARFFSLASQQQAQLNPQEMQLRAMLAQAAVLRPEQDGTFAALGTQAVVSFTAIQDDDPTTPADESIDARRRESVLLHELSHGEFFTDEKYRAYCWAFWRNRLSARERKLFVRYLESLDYDPGNEELMVNEMQAALVHTPDSRAFNAAALGMSKSDLERLRSQFRAGDPLSRTSAGLGR